MLLPAGRAMPNMECIAVCGDVMHGQVERVSRVTDDISSQIALADTAQG